MSDDAAELDERDCQVWRMVYALTFALVSEAAPGMDPTLIAKRAKDTAARAVNALD